MVAQIEPEYPTLGYSGLKVSEACLGAMNFGTNFWSSGCGEDEARRIVDAFLNDGGNFIDTADQYGDGESEEFVGRAIRGKRDSCVVATKAFRPRGPSPNEQGLSRVHLVRALDASLRRLQTDYIDLYQCHHPDRVTPIEETMATLDSFVRSGKVRYLGCSNFSAAQIVEAQWAAERVGGTRFISLQPSYSLLSRKIEEEILPVCARHGLGVMAYSPLAGGVLAGKYRRDATPEVDSRLSRLLNMAEMPRVVNHAKALLSEESLRVVDQVTEVATSLGTTTIAVALAWVRTHPTVTSVIIGPKTLDQYRDYLVGFSLVLPDEVRAELDRISDPEISSALVNG